MSALKVVFSMWIVALLYVVQLVELLLVICPMMLTVPSKGFWSGCMRQHGLFKVLSHTDHSIGSIATKKIEREDLWDSMFYSWSTRVPGVIIDKVFQLVSTTTRDGQIDIIWNHGARMP